MIKIKPSDKFIKLYDQASPERDSILCYISESCGYARMWVDKHLSEAVAMLSQDKQLEVRKRFKYNEIVIQLAWYEWYYTSWKKYSDYIINPALFQISYDVKEKIITIKEFGILTKVLTKLKKLIRPK